MAAIFQSYGHAGTTREHTSHDLGTVTIFKILRIRIRVRIGVGLGLGLRLGLGFRLRLGIGLGLGLRLGFWLGL